MTTASKWTLGIATAIVVVLMGFVVQIPMGPSADEIRTKIEQLLPVGTSLDHVSEFARREGMEQSPYLERERMVNAIKRGVARGLFSETSVYVRFYFDEKKALQRYTVEEVSTGL